MFGIIQFVQTQQALDTRATLPLVSKSNYHAIVERFERDFQEQVFPCPHSLWIRHIIRRDGLCSKGVKTPFIET